MDSKIVAYHGTPHGIFEKFSIDMRGKGADLATVGEFGNGFYFSPSKDYATSFAYCSIGKRDDIENVQPALYTVELEIKKALDFSVLAKFYMLNNDLVKKYGAMSVPDEETQSILSQVGIKDEEELMFYYSIENIIGDCYFDWDVAAKCIEKGYDAVISYDGKQIVVFNSEQIKIKEATLLELEEA